MIQAALTPQGSALMIAGASATIGLAAAVCEMLPLRIDDNLTIPLFVGFSTWIVTAVFGCLDLTRESPRRGRTPVPVSR